jgi:hypothetical protein
LSETRTCSRVGCNERYSLVIRGGRNSGKAMAGREHTYHTGRRYCSDTCRKLASKARVTIEEIRPVEASVTIDSTTPLSTVTGVSNSVDISMGHEGPNSGRASPKMDFGGFVVVPDPDWPKMYRVRRPDGSLTDMVNLARARDAAQVLAGAA